ARVKPGFEISLAAGERINHWSPLFEPRRYPFTVFETEPETPELYAVWPGTLPRDAAASELVLVGVPTRRPLYGTALELVAVAIAAGDDPPREWLRPEGAVLREHAALIA